MSTAPAPARMASIDRSRIPRAGAVAVLGSVLANGALLQILTPLLGLSAGFPPFNLGAIAFFTAFCAVLAVALFWLLARFSSQPVRLFTILAVVGFVITAIPNLALAANPAAAPFPGSSADFLTLLIFHLPPFAVILWALTSMTRGRG